VYGDEASTVIAGLQPLEGGEADFFAMASAGEAHVDLEALRCASWCRIYTSLDEAHEAMAPGHCDIEPRRSHARRLLFSHELEHSYPLRMSRIGLRS